MYQSCDTPTGHASCSKNTTTCRFLCLYVIQHSFSPVSITWYLFMKIILPLCNIKTTVPCYKRGLNYSVLKLCVQNIGQWSCLLSYAHFNLTIGRACMSSSAYILQLFSHISTFTSLTSVENMWNKVSQSAQQSVKKHKMHSFWLLPYNHPSFDDCIAHWHTERRKVVTKHGMHTPTSVIYVIITDHHQLLIKFVSSFRIP